MYQESSKGFVLSKLILKRVVLTQSTITFQAVDVDDKIYYHNDEPK